MTPDQINHRLAEAMGWELRGTVWYDNSGNFTGYYSKHSDLDPHAVIWTPYTNLNQAVRVADYLGIWKAQKINEKFYQAWVGKHLDSEMHYGAKDTPASALSLAIVAFLEGGDAQ